MDFGFKCRINGLSKDEARIPIEEEVSKFHADRSNILKIRRTLETVFYENDSWILSDSLPNYLDMTSTEQLSLYWALLMEAYPIFYDTCKSVGTLSDYRDIISVAQARQPVYDKWGSRSIIHQSVKKIFQTLKDFEVLIPAGSPGMYSVKKHPAKDVKLVCYLVLAALSASGSSYMTWENITGNKALFPFEIQHVTQADIALCKKLLLERMGDDIVIRIK